MTDVGLDYAWGRPSPDVMWEQGYRFISRYLSWLPNGKIITASELARLRARGFEVMLNWEYWGDWEHDFDTGAKGGTSHATEAVRQAKALGYPAGCSIYYSIDFDESPAQASTVEAYMRAAGDVTRAAGYRLGAYGGYWAIKRLFDAGVIDDGWQTYAWSGGRWDPRAALRQDRNGITVDGVDCDHNTRVGRTYLMGGPKEDDMELSDRVPSLATLDNQNRTVEQVYYDLWYAAHGRLQNMEKVLNQVAADVAALKASGGPGGPSHDELVEAAFEGAQRAEKE